MWGKEACFHVMLMLKYNELEIERQLNFPKKSDKVYFFNFLIL